MQVDVVQIDRGPVPWVKAVQKKLGRNIENTSRCILGTEIGLIERLDKLGLNHKFANSISKSVRTKIL